MCPSLVAPMMGAVTPGRPAVLVAARVAQGVGAALMAPNILSILGVVYTGHDRVRAISVYGMVMGLAATSGQLIGGVLIRSDLGGLGWRAIFWINVPLGVAALVACPRLAPESRADQGSRLDLAGVALITACLVAVVLPLVDGRQAGWPAWSWARSPPPSRSRSRSPSTSGARPTAAECPCSTRGSSPPGRCAPG